MGYWGSLSGRCKLYPGGIRPKLCLRASALLGRRATNTSELTSGKGVGKLAGAWMERLGCGRFLALSRIRGEIPDGLYAPGKHLKRAGLGAPAASKRAAGS